MKRVAKILLWIAGSIFAVCFVIAGVISLASLKSVRKAAADQKVCDARFAQLKHDLPIGTPRAEILHYVQSHGMNAVQFGGEGSQVSVDLGKIGSTVWYCSFFVEYADFSFSAGVEQDPGQTPLTRISTKSLGECL